MRSATGSPSPVRFEEWAPQAGSPWARSSRAARSGREMKARAGAFRVDTSQPPDPSVGNGCPVVRDHPRRGVHARRSKAVTQITLRTMRTLDRSRIPGLPGRIKPPLGSRRGSRRGNCRQAIAAPAGLHRGQGDRAGDANQTEGRKRARRRRKTVADKRDATEKGKLPRSAGVKRPSRANAPLTRCRPPSSLRPAPRRLAPKSNS
jgi:hypothetical protein